MGKKLLCEDCAGELLESMPVPDWVKTLARAGRVIGDGEEGVCSKCGEVGRLVAAVEESKPLQ